MKLNKIASLCVLACAAVSGQAFAAMTAAEQAILNDANANGRVVFVSGASAVQAGFDQIASSLFAGGGIRFANTTGSSRNFEAVAGKLLTAAGGWAANTNVIFVYRVLGGSVQGVNPVARAEVIDSLKVTAATCGATGSGTQAAPYVCTLGTAVPDAGISDVAPALFDSQYNTEGETAAAALSADELALLTSTPIYSLAFAVPVTKNVPLVHINKPAVAAIMAGSIGTWDQVDSSLPADDIVICRRVPGSGTQSVYNMYFGNYPCGLSNGPADRYASGAWDDATRKFTVTPGSGGLVVVENSTSGDVRKCLDTAATGGTYTTSDRDGQPVTVQFTAAGNKAIGVLSADSLSSSKTTGNWQFRSLDGAGTYTWDNTAVAPVASGTGKFPTLANLVNGSWDLQGWISFNVPARTVGNKAAFLGNFVKKAQDPAVLAALTNLKNVAAAISTDANPLPPSAQTVRAQYLGGNQCGPLNRLN
jgi:PBP superfamily domain